MSVHYSVQSVNVLYTTPLQSVNVHYSVQSVNVLYTAQYRVLMYCTLLSTEC